VVEQALERAPERAPGEPAAFLDEACGSDAALRREVEALLRIDAGPAGHVPPAA